jgi:hypothetical protein
MPPDQCSWPRFCECPPELLAECGRAAAEAALAEARALLRAFPAPAPVPATPVPPLSPDALDVTSPAAVAYLMLDPLRAERAGDERQNAVSVLKALSEPPLRAAELITLPPSPRAAAPPCENILPESPPRPPPALCASPPLFAHRDEAPVASGYVLRPHSDDLAFLREQTEDMESEDAGKEEYARFAGIWDALGFSAGQRLAMLVKYSVGEKSYAEFSRAAVVWEASVAAVVTYDRAYAGLKEALKMANVKIMRDGALWRSFDAAESGLREFVDTLRVQFTDTLIIRRKRAAMMMNVRRAKLKRLSEHR